MSIRFKGKTRYNPDWENPRLHPQSHDGFSLLILVAQITYFTFNVKYAKEEKCFFPI